MSKTKVISGNGPNAVAAQQTVEETAVVEPAPELPVSTSCAVPTAEHRRLVPPGGSSIAPNEAMRLNLTPFDLAMERVKMRRGEVAGWESVPLDKRRIAAARKRAAERAYTEFTGNVFINGTQQRIAEFNASERSQANEYENYRWEERENDDDIVFRQLHDEDLQNRRADADGDLEQQLLEAQWDREKRDDGLFSEEREERERTRLLTGDANDEQRYLERQRARERDAENAITRERDRDSGSRDGDDYRRELDRYYEQERLRRGD